ncbi:MAG: energy-coupling factor ABC transporter ATP-binding protein [Deltaproteobacteria bacterium]|nr:energy-coupling factor ABC transporter ATP-binding protein [Deltaproteobacteria bacterium]
MDSIIRLKDISFAYNKKMVFQNVDFVVNPGERIGLIGPNGSGKTTLLQIIMGLLKPQRGTIEVFGKMRKTDADFLEVRRKIGFLFQNSENQLFCPTVKEDIAFGPLNLGKSKDEALRIVKETCDILGLNGLEDMVTHKLSGGEKRLVALATVIAMKPLCFLLDEPSAELDEDAIERVLSYLKNYASTYVVVSHDKRFIEAATEKIYILKDGKLRLLT